MAYDVTALPAYVEQHKFELIAKALAGGKTAALVNMNTGVKGSAALNLMNSPVTLQADDCAFLASGTTTLSQRTLTVGAMKVNETLCEKDLIGKYAQTMIAAGANNETNVVFEDVFTSEKSKQIAKAIAIADWQGDTVGGVGNNSFYDGFIKVIDGSTAAVNGNTSATTVAAGITSANVISLLHDMVQALPVDVLTADDLVLFCGTDTYLTYQQALYNGNLYHYIADDAQGFDSKLVGYPNIRLIGDIGLTGTNRMFLGSASNFYIGVDMENDEEQYEMWYSQDDRINKFAVSFKRGTQVAFPDQIVEFTLV